MASHRSETGTQDGGVALGDAFHQVALGLSRVQEALRRKEEEVERRMQEALRLQEQRAAKALHDAVRPLQQKLLENEDAIRALEQRLNALSQENPDRAEERTVVSEMHGGEGDLRRLEDRVEKVEVSLQRAMVTFLPRVEALLGQLEKSQSTGASSVSTSIKASHVRIDNATTLEMETVSSQKELPPSGAHRVFSSAPSTSTVYNDHQETAIDEDREKQCIQLRIRETKSRMALARITPLLKGESLCKAAAEGRVNDVRRIINTGVDVNYTGKDGLTPLLCVIQHNRVNVEVVQLLLQHGADVNVVDRRGRSPLHFAAQKDHSGLCVDMLIAAGADVNTRSEAGATPLHAGARCNNLMAVCSLLAAGARRDIKGWDVHYKGKTPFDLAVSQNVRDLLRMYEEPDDVMPDGLM